MIFIPVCLFMGAFITLALSSCIKPNTAQENHQQEEPYPVVESTASQNPERLVIPISIITKSKELKEPVSIKKKKKPSKKTLIINVEPENNKLKSPFSEEEWEQVFTKSHSP